MLPIITTCGCSKTRMLMEKPNKTKKKVRIRKELSAVMECKKRVVSSTGSFKNRNRMRGILRSKSQLHISIPNTSIISNDGSLSILPTSYKIISKAKTRKKRMLIFVLCKIKNNSAENNKEHTMARMICHTKAPIAAPELVEAVSFSAKKLNSMMPIISEKEASYTKN